MAKTCGAVSKQGPDGPQRAQREKPQQIADEIRRLIIDGELVEGELLGHEPELIERFGVSRPSLREALRILGDDASPDERRVLGSFRYQRNVAVLHRDPALMPARRRACRRPIRPAPRHSRAAACRAGNSSTANR